MKSTLVTWLALLVLQALAVPTEKRQTKTPTLTELLLGERIDALIDRTGGRTTSKTQTAGKALELIVE